MPSTPLPERLTPLSAKYGLRAFFGDLHNHCNISYGHGSLQSALDNAERQLDFVSITGHAHWPDMPVDDPSVAHIVDFHVKGFAKLAQGWQDHFDVLQRAHKSGSFTVFPGYEIHSNAHGDYTVVLKSTTPVPLIKSDTPAQMLADFRKAYGDDVFAFPHHIGYRTGARGINWDTFIEELSPVLEMLSMHGCSETSLTERPFLHSMGPCDGVNTAHHGWNSGHMFGVLGNTDHHSGYPGSYGHGRSAVYAPENSSDAIWDAIHARHTNGLTGDNIHLFMAMGDAIAGDVVSPTQHGKINLEVVGGSFIDSIDIIKNGHLIRRITPDLEPSPITSGPMVSSGDILETILVVELGWGARGAYHDWAGSISVTGGTIDSLEPRLRGPDIVSPLEGDAENTPDPIMMLQDNQITYSVRAHANPNNFTPSMQTIAARVSLQPNAHLSFDFSGKKIQVPVGRLLQGALSGNLGTIDTPAFRIHPLPKPEQWQWSGVIDIGKLTAGDWVNARVRQKNGQWLWSTPFFCP